MAMEATQTFLLLESATEVAAWERGKAARKADLISERYGEPLTARSSDMPPGLPPPFDIKWTRGRSFSIDPDDTITLREFGSWQ
jgi:hypothetical protein